VNLLEDRAAVARAPSARHVADRGLARDATARQEPEFEESWRAFLHAWNVLQFHSRPPEVVSTEWLREGLEETGVESVRVAVTVADLEGADQVDVRHIEEAVELAGWL
jgi:predicted ATPase with chaperone activity